jgi:modification methylase
MVAKVHADGNVVIGNHRGSIHKVGALVQNAPSCNGWTYWHVKRNGKIVPIDTMRQELRARIESVPSATLQ